MENRLSLSGIFFKGSRHWKSSGKIQNTCKNETFEPEKIWRSNYLHVDVQWYWIDERRKFRTMYSNFEHVKNYTKFSQALWTSLGPGSESKWCGTQSYLPEGKWQATANQTVERFEESGRPVFKSVSPLARGILEEEERQRDHTLQLRMLRTQSVGIEQFIQQISSVSTEQSQAGVKSLVWSLMKKLPTTMNDNILKDVQPKEVNSLVMAPRNEEPAAGNRLREVQQKSSSQELAGRRHSSIKSLVGDTTEQCYTWMMVSEIDLPHAENTHVLVRTLIPDSLLMFEKHE